MITLLVITLPLLSLLLLLHHLRNNYLLFISIYIYNRCILLFSFARLLIGILIIDDSSYFERRLHARSPEFLHHCVHELAYDNYVRIIECIHCYNRVVLIAMSGSFV